MGKPEKSYFTKLIGRSVWILIRPIHNTTYLPAKLFGIEHSGLWIQSQEITAAMLANVSSASAPKTPIVFIPFHEISAVLSSVDEVPLNEEAFGLKTM